MRREAFIGDGRVLHSVRTRSGTFGNGAINGVFGHTLLFRNRDGGSKASVEFRNGTAELTGNLNFANKLAHALTLRVSRQFPPFLFPLRAH